jgi:PIN domain nuclease of toxin-antitoxin system
VTVLDAYAVLAYLKGERAASEVRPLLGFADSSLTALGVAEVLDHLVRLAGANEEDATLDLAQLGLIDGIDVDSTIGAAAGRLRARYYHRTRCPVSLADCVAAEVARSRQQPLATADPALLDVCHTEGIPVAVLTASNGSRWDPPAVPYRPSPTTPGAPAQ